MPTQTQTLPQGSPTALESSGLLRQARAVWVSRDTIAWNPEPVRAGWDVALHAAPAGGLALSGSSMVGGTSIPLAFEPAGLPHALRQKYPHLAGYAAFRLPRTDPAQVRELLRGQLAVSARAADGSVYDATGLQLHGALDDLCAYGGELGASFAGRVPTLRVWAPTARSVRLLLYADSRQDTAAEAFPMSRDAATGVWSLTGDASWYGRYYLYEVQVFVRATGRVEANRVTDPYSVSLSRNSQRTQILDLADPAWAPPGWPLIGRRKPRLDAPTDIVLYELHVRDMSAHDATVPAAERGTFQAFTRKDSDGMRHLAALARAGLSHVHLLPVFDIATIDEDKSTWQSPAGDLASFPPDSPEPQARVAAVADTDGYNWGYDPWHYSVPEGSYATDPDGPARILEFRRMVQALSEIGLRVVMDVVYNHTYASGQSGQSVLDRIVPGYYHRLNAWGDVENSSCCANTASENAMMGKLLVDSVVQWAKHYAIDGFRFDLMGHHMKRNLIEVRAALSALTLERDGVDGRKIYLYGEGWSFGEVAHNARGINASQANLTGTGIGTFSDRLRDALRGGGPFAGIQEQGFATGLGSDPNATHQGSAEDQEHRLRFYADLVKVGLAGHLSDFVLEDRFGHRIRAGQLEHHGQPAGYAREPAEVVNYVDAHDNETLFDAVQLKLPVGAAMADRVRASNLAQSVVLLAQGVPFFHAGTDLLRSKSLDRNSYNSGDWFNKLDFTGQSNNWGVGLPPARDNQQSWWIHGPLLANPALTPTPADIRRARDHFREMLAVRRSSPLFRLRTAEEVSRHLRFHNTGPSQNPGLVVLELADPEGQIDRRFDRLVAIFNQTPWNLGCEVADLRGTTFALHDALAHSTDPVVRTAAYDSETGVFTVPGRTTAVFVSERPLDDQIGRLGADVDALVAAGRLARDRGDDLRSELAAARDAERRGQELAAKLRLDAFLLKASLFVSAGHLAAEDARALREDGRSLFEHLFGNDDRRGAVRFPMNGA